MSCDVLKFEECDGGAATVINIDFPHIAREVGGESRRVYVRFRLYIDQNSGLAKRNDSRDRLFTSAFSREEAIDLRINDYRTLSDEMREKVDGVDPDAYPLKSVTVHTLLMARTSVAVESFEDLHEKRLLEGIACGEATCQRGSQPLTWWHGIGRKRSTGQGTVTRCTSS